ncbi:MAG: hypothetical protein AAGD32_07275 [Planctomycetota bacterium]
MTFVPPAAGSPDYELALRKVRRLRSLALLLLAVVLLMQLVIFFLAHYATIEVIQSDAIGYTTAELSGGEQVLHYLLGATTSLGVLVSIVLVVAILAQALLITADRRLGVAPAVAALGWSLALLVLTFPTQLFLTEAALTRSVFALPGVLYTFGELRMFGVASDDWGSTSTYLNWLRFVVAPLATLLVVVLVLLKSGRGFKLALGELGTADRIHTEPSDTVA